MKRQTKSPEDHYRTAKNLVAWIPDYTLRCIEAIEGGNEKGYQRCIREMRLHLNAVSLELRTAKQKVDRRINRQRKAKHVKYFEV